MQILVDGVAEAAEPLVEYTSMSSAVVTLIEYRDTRELAADAHIESHRFYREIENPLWPTAKLQRALSSRKPPGFFKHVLPTMVGTDAALRS